jgi:hypothetical protein
MIDRNVVVNSVRTQISDSLNVTFSALDMDAFITDAITEYSRHRPIIKTSTVTVSALEDTYALPDANLVEVIDAHFETTYDYTFVEPEMLPPIIGDDYALDRIDMVRQSQLVDRPDVNLNWNGTAYELLLSPIPSGSGTLVLTYTVAHTPDLLGNYPSIPTRDTGIITKMVLANTLRSIAIELEKRGSMQTGDARTDYSNSVKSMRQAANQAMNDAMNSLSGGVTIMRF